MFFMINDVIVISDSDALRLPIGLRKSFEADTISTKSKCYPYSAEVEL